LLYVYFHKYQVFVIVNAHKNLATDDSGKVFWNYCDKLLEVFFCDGYL